MNRPLRHIYANGLPYRSPRSSVLPVPFLVQPRSIVCIEINHPGMDWATLWQRSQARLRHAGFSTSTLRVYRRILRTFRTFAATHPHPGLRVASPTDITRPLTESFIHHLQQNRVSGSWLSTNIAVLRTVFDKLAGCTVTAYLRTPRRPGRLPEVLSVTEMERIIQSAVTVRDRLIVGLLYGCGLKVGELCALKWQDVDLEHQTITVHYARNTRTRLLPIPSPLLPILSFGVQHSSSAPTLPSSDLSDPTSPSSSCHSGQSRLVVNSGSFIFPGAIPDQPLTARLVERMISRTARMAGIEKSVTCMTLRHSYAVECLRMGMPITELRQKLGHQNIETTLDYQRFVLPADAASPANHLFDSESPPDKSAQRQEWVSDSRSPPWEGYATRGWVSDSGSHPWRDPQHERRVPSLPAIGPLPPELPFPALTSGTCRFLTFFRTRLRDGLLALRNYVTPPSPP